MSVVLFASCSKDDPAPEEFNGSPQSISDFLEQELYDAVIDLGFNIYSGNQPPNISNKYLLAPAILENSSVPGDTRGIRF